MLLFTRFCIPGDSLALSLFTHTCAGIVRDVGGVVTPVGPQDASAKGSISASKSQPRNAAGRVAEATWVLLKVLHPGVKTRVLVDSLSTKGRPLPGHKEAIFSLSVHVEERARPRQERAFLEPLT